jgi:alpha-galactosidase
MSVEPPVMLTAAGVCLIVDVDGPGLPRIRHYGDEVAAGDLGALGVLRPTVRQLPLVPSQADGWFGRPALRGHREGATVPVRWALERAVTVDSAGRRIVAEAADEMAELALRSELELDEHGVLRMRHTVTNGGLTTYTVDALNCLLPVPSGDADVLDFTGRWAKEKTPQRAPLRHGTWARESRRGRTGHDAPGLLIVGDAGFGFGHGEVRAVHTAWSGGHLHYVDRLPEGLTVLGGGELLESAEIVLASREAYTSPWVYFSFSKHGLDDLSARLHAHLRDGSPRSRGPRPVTLNNWEATYFDHGFERLHELATRAAEVGAERFVLDDGWFRHRRDDHAGLGDWYVDEGVWPQGLHPLVAHVRELGLQFGLWFEPEMVNPDSDLARAHPDWILGQPGRWPVEQRNQQTLDLARPEVYEYLLERLDALIGEYAIDYVKWDHNRDLAEPVHAGVLGVHRQTEAVYRLIDELRRRHPALEIESCSSGGARIDYGILARTDRVWTSDCNDALERQGIQRWTGLLVPPEMLGAHVGAPVDHTTGRALPLSFRCLTALFGHMGIEWDITAASDAERADLAGWIELHKRLRPLLHSGRVVRIDHPDETAIGHGVVSRERDHAVFAYLQLDARVDETPGALRLPGLDPGATYRVTAIGPDPAGATLPIWTEGAVEVSGALLGSLGLPVPALVPTTGFLAELRRI